MIVERNNINEESLQNTWSDELYLGESSEVNAQIIFDSKNYIPFLPTMKPYISVGRILLKKRKGATNTYCTGFLVGNDIIMTSLHSFSAGGENDPYSPELIKKFLKKKSQKSWTAKFWNGYSDFSKKKWSHAGSAKVVDLLPLVYEFKKPPHLHSFDYICLKLESTDPKEPLGKKYGFFKCRVFDPQKDKKLIYAGYGHLDYHKKCHWSIGNAKPFTNIITYKGYNGCTVASKNLCWTQGASGGPILSQRGNEIFVVGVAVGEQLKLKFNLFTAGDGIPALVKKARDQWNDW